MLLTHRGRRRGTWAQRGGHRTAGADHRSVGSPQTARTAKIERQHRPNDPARSELPRSMAVAYADALLREALALHHAKDEETCALSAKRHVSI